MSGPPSPLVSAEELAGLLTGALPPAVLDATLVLHPARFDGDFRAESGRPGWVAGHVPGSRHVALDVDFSVPHTTHDHHPEPQAVVDALAALGVTEGAPVVVYDRAGGLWAARLWYLLDWVGVDARVLDGGFARWREAGLAVRSGEDAPVPAPAPAWRAVAARRAWVTREELVEGTATGNLVCGLPAAAFAGAVPTRYSRRGHIPGSTSVPTRELFDERGLLLPPEEVLARHRAAGADLDRELLLYCGGGISATVNALALASAGVRHTRVYDGSLEEWSADPDLPLVLA